MNPRRAAILREMGLTPLWRLRAIEPETESEEPAFTDVQPEPAPERPQPEIREAARPRAPVVVLPVSPPERAAAASEASALPAAPAAPPVDVSRVAGMGWEELEETIRACRACALCERRTQAVPGVGDRQARWMFVGEGPGEAEDRRGEPFVGPAGQLLDRMLEAIGLKRGEGVYIANAVKCRPPHNRTPEAGEIAACAAFLDRQIALVQPRLLIALGRPAAQALLGREINISAARRKRFEHKGIPVVVTYHPAYLLRNPQDKGKAWEDLCFARNLEAGLG